MKQIGVVAAMIHDDEGCIFATQRDMVTIRTAGNSLEENPGIGSKIIPRNVIFSSE